MAEQIKIDADVSGVLGAVNKLKTAAQGLNKTLGSADVTVRTDQAQKSLSSLTATADAARKALAAAGSAFDLDASTQAQAIDELKAALDDIANLSVDGIDLKVDTTKARAQIESLRRELQQKTAAAVGPGGGAGSANLDTERRRSLREEREERNRLKRAGPNKNRQDGDGGKTAPKTGAQGATAAADPRAQASPESFFTRLGKQLRSDPQTGRLGRVTGAAGGIAGGLMSGSGSGGMMRSIGSGAGTLGGAAIGTLIGGPLGAIVGGLAGSLLGSIGGSSGGKMDEAIGDVITEGLDLSNLQRSVGSTNAGFGELQQRLRDASGGLQTTFVEMAKYGQTFARQANYRGDASELAEEVKNAVGYARGFGADPQAGVQFMATMRHTKASNSDQDSRKLGISVAEAIGRGGLGPKTDEVLTAIGNFANQAANSALTAPDVSSFSSVLGTASATGIAGLAGNPANAAAIIGQADSAMRQGGAFGQASSVLTDLALRKQGMNFGDVNLLKEQGLFGTENDAFGADSTVQKSLQAKIADTTGSVSESEKAQLRADLARYQGLATNGDGRTNADKVMGRLREMSPNQTEYRESLKSHFGLKTASQAEAFDTVMRTHGGTGALSRRLESAGVDTRNLNALSIGGMSEAATADRAGLQRMGNETLKDKEFSSKNRDLTEKLRNALGGSDTEALRDALFLAKEKGAGNMTEVERANQAAIDLKNEFMKYAQAILPAVTAAKDGILALVEKIAPNSEFAKQAKAEREMVEKAQSGDAAERARQAERAAQMVASGKTPISPQAAKLAQEGAASMAGGLDRRASEFEANAEKAKKSWFLPGYRSKNLEESARELRDRQANLQGLAYSPANNSSDIAAPQGAIKDKGPAPEPKVGAAAPQGAVKDKGPAPEPKVGAAAPQGAVKGENLQNRALLERAAEEAGITDPREKAHFMGQMSHESGGFNRLLEGASGAAYEGRANLGNTQAGDGKLFKGRGFVQLTGRYNYKKYGKQIGEDLIADPDRASDPEVAAKLATAYWKDRGVGAAARRGDTESVTKLINGGRNGIDDRVRRTQAEYALAGLDASGSPVAAAPGVSTPTLAVQTPAANPFASALVNAPPSENLQPIPSGGKDGPGALASGTSAPGGQQAVKVISEIIVRDQNGASREDVQARPLSYESLPAGVPA